MRSLSAKTRASLAACVALCGTLAQANELDCLAFNIYHEARSEPLAGQYAVAYVTLNRVKDSRWPNSICEVVKQKKRNICQFSWYCDGKDDRPYEVNSYIESRQVALDVLINPENSWLNVGQATHYHTVDVSPNWSKSLEEIGTVGRHIFYR